MTRARHALLFWLAAVLAACAGLGAPPSPTPRPTPTATLDTPSPEGVAATFLDLWQQGDFTGMYSLLSPLSQDAVSPAEFEARYRALTNSAAITGVETRVLSALKTGQSAQVLYEVNLHTAFVGTVTRRIEMPLVFTGGRWAIAWSEALVLPELVGGNTLLLEASWPARANIYDRNGLGLAVQGEAVAIGVQPNLIQDEAAVVQVLSEVLGMRPEAIRAKWAAARPDWYVPIGEASAEDVQARLADLTSLSGIFLNRYTTRFYPYGGVAAHVVGYLSAIPPEALSAYRAEGYSGDERVGRAGLEAWAEPYLAGTRGGKLSVVSPAGQVVATLAESRAQPAQAVYATIDRALQLGAQEALASFKGAAIILDPHTGEVLAMVSSPSFDPNLFDPTNRNSEGLEAVLTDPARPLLNRAAQGQYPPGSVFKIAAVGAGLLSGLYTRDTAYTCTGVWNVLGPDAVKYDWTVQFGVPPHGRVNLVEALAYSCDPYFYTLAYDLYHQNPDFLSQVSRQFGLGQFTQIGQVAEAEGLIPDPEWKRAAHGEQWTPGDSVNMGIGQGFVLSTPLQIVQMVAAVANGGTLLRPQLVHHIAPPGGEASYALEPIVNGQLPISAEQLALIQEGMRAVTQNAGGTARHRFVNFEIPVVGKTGTAEDPAQGLPHAWFAGYTEAGRADRPDVAIVVVVENIGEGSVYAAPIFRRLVEIYFFGRPQTLYPWETEFGVSDTPGP